MKPLLPLTDRPARSIATALAVVLSLGAPALAQDGPPPKPVTVDEDGTVHVPAMAVPVSEFLSPEGQAYLTEHLLTMQKPELLKEVEGFGGPAFLQAYLSRQQEIYDVEKEDTSIGGVHVYDYTPADGIAPENENRVLINLHGGGFITCWPACGELESTPVSALGKIRVVSVDYRQGPEHKFPAASEDVAKVYRELLETYPAENIGIYGCSAGGMLTGMSVAWFQAHDLPRPGAVGIHCAGLASPARGFGGDANYIATPIGEGRFMVPPSEPEKPSAAVEAAEEKEAPRSPMGYLSDVDPTDPLVAPAESEEVLAQFPPTQIFTGTRGFELSSAVYTHSELVRLGVEADLHVWEGMFHGFFYNPDVPESQTAYRLIVDFFDDHLGQ